MSNQSNKPPGGTPSAAEFGKMRAWLAIHGWSQAQITDAVGQQPNGRSRSEIANQLKQWIANNG